MYKETEKEGEQDVQVHESEGFPADSGSYGSGFSGYPFFSERYCQRKSGRGKAPADQKDQAGRRVQEPEQTAECGGNALHIDEHRYPDLRSTCHRIWGTMYIIPDSIVNKYPSQSIQEVEERYDEALLEAMVATQLEQEEKRKKELDNPKNVIMVNAGVSWITSEIQTPLHLYKNHAGFGMNVDYQHIWGSGLGLGIDYLYYNTSFDGDITYNTHYIGPSIVGSMMSRNSLWRMNLALGIGYAYNTENVSASIYGYPSSKSESSVGFFGQIGAEYKLAKHVGVGIQLSYLTMRLDRPEGYDTSKYKFYGVKRFDLMAGLRFYL